MPKLGLVMKKGKIIKWYKQAGDPVKEGEPLFQISTEKVTIDVEAKASGYLRAIFAGPGAVVPVSGIVGLLGNKDEPLPDIKPPAYEIDTKGMDDTGGPKNAEAGLTVISAEDRQEKDIKASPAAKRLAREKGIDLVAVKGTGPGGRITETDIMNFKQDMPGSPPAPDGNARTSAGGQSYPAGIPATPYARKLAEERGFNIGQVAQSAGDRKIYAQDVINTSLPSGSGQDETAGQSTLMPLTDIRSAVADRMSYSARTVAPVTLGMEVMADELLKLKNALSLSYPSDKVTINDILVKLTAVALKKHPLANASWEENGIRVYQYVNMGIGVAIEGGLIVPAIANADRKNITQISREAKDLIERAKSGRLTFEELSRGTFTLTNLGAFGIDMFTPIINPPQSATLGVGRIVKKPWVVNDRIEVVSAMVLSLTFDHRIIDGAPAAQCLMTIRQYIENPYLALIDGPDNSPQDKFSPSTGGKARG